MNDFLKNKYYIVKNAVDPTVRDLVTQYALFDEMQDFSPEKEVMPGAEQVAEAHAKYSDPLMESILIYLQPIIEKEIEIQLYPTYSYFRVYRKNDKLDAHIDRESCEISATVCFNFSYDINNYSWPIFMEGQRMIQYPGDILIYRGCELSHWRDLFDCSDNDWQVQGFFHYVNAEGPFREFRFDRRPSLGHIEKKTKIKNGLNKPYLQFKN